jgi:hypothetical protein
VRRLRPGLAQPQRGQRGGRDHERGRVEDRHRGAAGRRVQPGAGDRRHEPEALAHRLQQRVRLAELLGRHERHEQRGLAGGEQRVRPAVHDRDGVQEPDAVTDEQQREHDPRARQIHRDQQRAAAHAIDEQPRER